MGELMSVVDPALSSSPRPKRHYRGWPVETPGPSVDAFACNQPRLLLAAFGYQIIGVTSILDTSQPLRCPGSQCACFRPSGSLGRLTGVSHFTLQRRNTGILVALVLTGLGTGCLGAVTGGRSSGSEPDALTGGQLRQDTCAVDCAASWVSCEKAWAGRTKTRSATAPDEHPLRAP